MVVTDRARLLLLLCSLLTCVQAARAAVLPEERADLLYHSYDGGGVEINGPSLLVRKQVNESFSVFGNYYIDSVTSASIDVIATASPYSEERTETSFGVDYLRDRTTMSLAYTLSDESDFTAKSLHFGISQEVFGGMTTVSLGYSRGWDEVGKRGDSTFNEDVDRQHYRAGISQVLTKDWIIGANIEGITDEGFLNNPYRQVRYLDTTSASGYSYEPEVYPRTRTSIALALRTKYYLPYRAALHGEYRIYDDTWGIRANTYELRYTHPLKDRWILDLKLRGYDQTEADFYSDLFPFQGAQNFLARDKELSRFNSNTVGVGVSYQFTKGSWGFIDRGTLNLSYERIQFDYDNFRDVTAGGTPGAEPLYSFSADVIQLYLSIWY